MTVYIVADPYGEGMIYGVESDYDKAIELAYKANNHAYKWGKTMTFEEWVGRRRYFDWISEWEVGENILGL